VFTRSPVRYGSMELSRLGRRAVLVLELEQEAGIGFLLLAALRPPDRAFPLSRTLTQATWGSVMRSRVQEPPEADRGREPALPSAFGVPR
jgi:hypothetical protein